MRANISRWTIESVSICQLGPSLTELHYKEVVVRGELLRYGQQLGVVPEVPGRRAANVSSVGDRGEE